MPCKSMILMPACVGTNDLVSEFTHMIVVCFKAYRGIERVMCGEGEDGRAGMVLE